jgi:cell fate (sporulation/competence/biofilm development) regulator YlbF (YheA/YmcA/DUF963 family)
MIEKTYWDGIRDVINTLEGIVDNDPKVLNLLTAQQALSILLTGLKRDVEENG